MSQSLAISAMAAIATSFSAAAAIAHRRSRPHLQLVARRRAPFSTAASSSSAPSAAAAGFGWTDALRVASDTGLDDESDLSGYFRKVDICNRGMDKKGQFVEFLVEDQVVGYIHKGDFNDVFSIVSGNNCNSSLEHVTLHSSLKTQEDRTIAIGNVIKGLGELIPGIRNEETISMYSHKVPQQCVGDGARNSARGGRVGPNLSFSDMISSFYWGVVACLTIVFNIQLYPVTSSYGTPVYFSLERAAAPYFGIKAYGVHMNGYIEADGEKSLWIGKRSDVKQTYPGMLDHLVAGGLPYGISCKENIIKECEEEAGIPRSMSTNATSVGAISYVDIDGFRYKRDVLFCYDLRLPADFVPNNEDGEVDSFRLIPVRHAGNIIRRTDYFKANCNLVIIDFLFRHGYIKPDYHGYLKLLQSLRSGDCS
ncbi:nudix hydrolase 20, chloroplastic isoform X2 [Brachypodium distachyon]|uniref:nudix hydrolase 20, chloroplastic isoform X2 n=1 Tax=Brachypodium distachyon TaxID=15368 RepID=UPI000D0CE7FC|nr:nudix hydrolase 20, chloroplastic isoform X2 [Brachypodium distachyon]|eukprot:XP_024318998.1 nudix hydrolase 20, chloroplastic isoform X2 [Brachypodium distachyon]